MIEFDCHMHTEYSSDSSEPMEEQIRGAIELGLKGICITDHMDYYFPDAEKYNMDFLYDIDKNYEDIDRMRLKYGDRLEILKGIELGLRNEPEIAQKTADEYSELLKRGDIDFVIGSTHCLENTDPYRPEYWEKHSPVEGLRIYFEAVLENVRRNPFIDTLGHLDYAVRYVPVSDQKGREWAGTSDYRVSDYNDYIDEILKSIIDRGIALEVNSAGLKYGLGFAHPRNEILVRYRELGGELITIGSDAHKRIHIAYDFDKTAQILTDLGYKYYAVFRNRKPCMNSLN